MPDKQDANLFDELTRIGIDADLARRMDKSLDPEHVATKKDLMVFQETMLQMQFRNEKSMSDLRDRCSISCFRCQGSPCRNAWGGWLTESRN